MLTKIGSIKLKLSGNLGILVLTLRYNISGVYLK